MVSFEASSKHWLYVEFSMNIVSEEAQSNRCNKDVVNPLLDGSESEPTIKNTLLRDIYNSTTS